MDKRHRMVGKQSVKFENEVFIVSESSVAGEKEGEGPLGGMFDQILNDPLAGENTWEQGEAKMQFMAAKIAIKKAGLTDEQIRYVFSGDLLNQLIATTYGLIDLQIPVFGLYGACSTMGEALSLGSITIASGAADNVLAMASSHFAGAEKNYRFPLEYGNQRPLSATWTVTGCGALVLANKREGKNTSGKISGITTGKIVDFGIMDSMNMGAVMAPAAASVIESNLCDFNVYPESYDKIITGDLGYAGKEILIDLLKGKGIDISKNHMDCGIEIFSQETQDTHCGGSGCGCSACVLSSYIMKNIKDKIWNHILFIPTGAMLSQVSFNEGMTIPAVAHAVVIDSI